MSHDVTGLCERSWERRREQRFVLLLLLYKYTNIEKQARLSVPTLQSVTFAIAFGRFSFHHILSCLSHVPCVR